MTIISAGKIESFDGVQSIGVGLIESATILTEVCILKKPSSLVFIGSAGSYGETSLLSCHTSFVASQIEHSYLLSKSYTPINTTISSIAVPRETTKLNLKAVTTNSSNFITTSKKISSLYASKNLDIENMEFFSVLSVANHFKIPAVGIFVVTNYCDKNAHKEYLSNIDSAKKIMQTYINRLNSNA